MKDYYKVLGIPRTASSGQIKQAYRVLCKRYHPDKNPSPEATRLIQKVNEAYEVLSEASRKASYDLELRRQEWTTTSRTAPVAPDDAAEEVIQEVFCKRCHIQDTTLRLSIFYDVSSFIFASRRTRHVHVLCAACRSKLGLWYNVETLVRGWWHPLGFFWTLHAVCYNTVGGEQPRPYNAALLASLGDNLYRKGRSEEARVVLRRSVALRPNADVEAMLKSIRQQGNPPMCRRWKGNLFLWRAHPAVYNAPVVALAVAGLVALLSIVGNQSAMMIRSRLAGSTKGKSRNILIYRGTQRETVNTP